MKNQSCTLVTKHLFEYLNLWCETRPLGSGCMLVTPFQHYDQSFIELYTEFREGKIFLSDDGETLAMLFVSGLTIKRHSPLFHMVEQIAQEHGVLFEQETLSIYATEDTLGEMTYALIHAIQSVGFLIYRRTHPDNTLQQMMDEMSDEAQARGLTPEVLEQILCGDG